MEIIQNGFNEEVFNDTNHGYLFEIVDSEILLITFGGILQGIAIAPFEFFNLLKDFNVNKLFIRDSSQSWYHSGVLNIGNSIEQIAQEINNLIFKYNIKKTVVIGNSAGGYAAILIGVLVNADEIHAFAPQTFLSPFKRFYNFDFRWSKELNSVYKLKNTKYYDLHRFLNKEKSDSEINIYYCNKHRLDSIHAKSLSNFNNVKLFDYSEGGHTVIKHIKSTGELLNILSKALK